MLRFPRHEVPNIGGPYQPYDASVPLILIVEDNEAVAQCIATLVCFMGFRAKVALNAMDALECLKQEVVEVLLTDIILGNGMDGLEMSRLINALYPRTKGIVMSGYAQDEITEEGLIHY